jgi:hypothetical protein
MPAGRHLRVKLETAEAPVEAWLAQEELAGQDLVELVELVDKQLAAVEELADKQSKFDT